MSRSSKIYERRTEEVARQTIDEWNARMDRLNGIDTGQVQPKITKKLKSGPSKKQNYAISPPPPSGKLTNYELWASSQHEKFSSGKYKEVPISNEEIEHIERCFKEADVDGDGLLNCEEFKNFMEFRSSPITHWDARKLLATVDAMSSSHISLSQIMFLVTNCGLTTSEEVPMSEEEFQKIVQRLHSSIQNSKYSNDILPKSEIFYDTYENMHIDDNKRRSSGGNKSAKFEINPNVSYYERSIRPRESRILKSTIPMDKSLTYFEEMASEVQEQRVQESLYKKYRQEVRKGPKSKSSNQYFSNFSPHPPQIQNPPIEETHIPYKKVLKEWETKSHKDLEAQKSLLYKNPIEVEKPLKIKKTHRKIASSQMRGFSTNAKEDEKFIAKRENSYKDERNVNFSNNAHKINEENNARINEEVKSSSKSPTEVKKESISVPGRPMPFIISPDELQNQIHKIFSKNKKISEKNNEVIEKNGNKISVIYKAHPAASKPSGPELN